MKGIAALTAAAIVAGGCGEGSKPASPEKVAVEWLQAKAAYDGGKAWDLEAPGYRGTDDRKKAVEERKRERAEECPQANGSSCLFRKDVKFTATGQRKEGRCFRILIRDEGAEGKAHESAVITIRIDNEWRVRDWFGALPEDRMDLAAARDCGVS